MNMEMQNSTDNIDNLFELDILDVSYKNWEEIPVSTLRFNSQTSQVCYISVPKNKATTIMNTKAVPVKTVAFEYIENIKPKQDEVILAIEIDTSNMLDMLNEKDFIETVFSNTSAEQYALNKNKSLIRTLKNTAILPYSKILYIILNNSAVKDIHKI